MIWRFTILDRYNNATVINEPPGWDKNTAEIKRDLDYHGVMFNNQGENFEFYGSAMQLLKDEYDQFGWEGIMYLVEEEDCGNGFVEFSRNKFLFAKYKLVEDVVQFIRIPLENADETMNFRNRLNQKVNLDTALAFDETTALAAYDKLGFEMELPSKGIFIQDRALVLNDSVEVFDGGLQAVLVAADAFPDSNLSYEQIEFGMPDEQLSEIGNFNVYPTHLMNFSEQNGSGTGFTHFPNVGAIGQQLYPLNCNPLINYSVGSANYGDISNPVSFDIRIKGALEILQTYYGNGYIYLLRLPARPTLTTNGENEADFDYLAEYVIRDQFIGNLSGYLTPNSTTLFFDFIFNQNVTINKGDRFYLFLASNERKTQTQIDAVNAGAKAYSLTIDTDSYIKITNLSHTAPTRSKAYMINEVISRVAEVITNNNLKAYSEYFGRTDSEPYALPADGCGSLEAVTDGIRIRRQENKIPGKTNLFSLSIQDIFEGINPIHNIGMGLEDDTNRPGFKRLRVEPWNFFYNDNVILSCTGINKISRECYDKNIYSTFQYGYSKWEAEQYNGLDEFLTKRISRTTLSQVKNDLIKLSKWIASGYAWEVTRRIGNNDSKDWRYDKDTFIVCATRVPTFKVKFDPAIPGFTFEYTGDISIFIGATITVANSQFNNFTYPVFSYSFSGTTVTVKVSGGVITAEDTYGVTFPSVPFPAANIYVELGNAINTVNIVDPATLYNWRIRPAYNAMRWMNRVLMSYKQFTSNAKIIFTDGDGNYFAEGEMRDINCKLESGVIAENDPINNAVFDDVNDAMPFMMPERVVYEYPMNTEDYNLIKANPYGLIYFESECESGYGWIDTINYKKEDGIATFNLIPKVS